ncbi:hypothetical protein KXV92_003416 [Aspergillus fumigatus]|nr:hypothetical protein KXX42_003023 [Aspergillus fumigatus]KAH2302758.1 hypothetical protein KXV47_000930 [Aspergillus fumigatus]KAH2656781.1 hypothetical protein KXV32_002147 [Aspergillus fumigatus]KAH3007150.1 hypothetical protein KXW60_003173 [Aspergillus fumigatus]KAH3140176.1 hypothetical protein KXW18_003464 [Aspergillus fumigatus]
MDSLDGTDVKASIDYGDHGSGPDQQKGLDEHRNVPQVRRQLADDLSQCHWTKLQQLYSDIMKQHGNAEEELRARSLRLIEIFTAWSQSAVLRDESRALKRFKTQSQHVQTSEEDLESRRKHYADVVKAFESALALLNNAPKS